MASHEGEDPAGGSTGVLHDDVATADDVAAVGDNEGPAGGAGWRGGAVREEGIEDVAGDAILLWDELRGVVLDVAGLADELGEERDKGVPVEVAHQVLQGSHAGGGFLRDDESGDDGAQLCKKMWRDARSTARR